MLKITYIARFQKHYKTLSDAEKRLSFKAPALYRKSLASFSSGKTFAGN